MKNNLTYTAVNHTATTIPSSLKHQFGLLRYKCFQKDDPNVNLDHENAVEFDHFDEKPSTIYAMVVDSNANLIAAMRLIPTTEQYELESESYRYMTDKIALPKDKQIFEGSRWVCRGWGTMRGDIASGLLMMRLYRLGQEYGFNKVIGVQTTVAEQTHSEMEVNSERASDYVRTDRDKDRLMVSYTFMNDQYHRAGKDKFFGAFTGSDTIDGIDMQISA